MNDIEQVVSEVEYSKCDYCNGSGVVRIYLNNHVPQSEVWFQTPNRYISNLKCPRCDGKRTIAIIKWQAKKR